ncbi:MAG: hypothetical protein II939_00910 [Bacteroidales bacterium]|nr:hypothetical protein [Bacteroidales bacterium]
MAEDKLQKPLHEMYEFYTSVLERTNYNLNSALFNKMCQRRTVLSIKMHIQQSGKKPTERAIFDNYVIMDNSQLTIHNA